MKLFKKLKTNNKGLSLVELICAVAILSIVFIAVGSAMVVSAQSYSRGTYELDVQQEAQTITNLVGNLLVDAVEATFDKVTDPAMPVLTIKGEGVTYKVTHDTANATLEYEEVDAVGNISTGILAENVTNFDTNLDTDPDTFNQDRNVEVAMEVEKNGRTYEAAYDTTARNGSANAVGAAETLNILVDTQIVLEPNQTYLLPVTVVGSATNKAIKVTKDNVSDPITVTAVNGSSAYVSVTVHNDATGVIPFVVSTLETDDVTTLPLDTKTVNVQVRRVSSVSGIATPTGTDYLAGTTYKVDFTVNGDYMDKVYGKDFDTDYVNPRQVSFSYNMTGMEDGYVMHDYIDASSISFVYTDTPYMTFKLLRDMPFGAEITVTATALHPQTVNKTGTSYASGIFWTVSIKRPNNYMYPDSELRRGSDGIEVLLNSEYMNSLIALYGNNFKKYYRVYEVWYDADGNETSRSGVKFESDMIDSGSVTMIRAGESERLKPSQDYILEMFVRFYDDAGNVMWPIEGTTPKEEYSCEYPLDAAACTFEYQVNNNLGYSDSPYSMTKGNMDESIKMNFTGLEMSKYPKDHADFYVEKWTESTGWITYTGSKEIDVMNGSSDGTVTTKFKIEDTGRFRVKVYLNNIPYKSYDGTTTHYENFDLFDETTGQGIFYININS